MNLSVENDVCGLISHIWGTDVPCKVHDVWTPDGYLLRLKRIKRDFNLSSKGIVLMYPGLGDTSATFVVSGRNESLAGLLFEQGYEIFLLDGRGRAPLIHKQFNANEKRFWEWSLDEKFELDLPLLIQASMNISGENSVKGLIGHSQGALIILAALAENKDIASIIKQAFLLAPPLSGWSPDYAYIPEGTFLQLENILPTNNLDEVFQSIRAVISRSCLIFPTVCSKITCLLSGCGSGSKFSESKLPEIFSFYPTASSFKNAEHLMKCERSAGLVHYREGRFLNFSKISIPLHFYFGTHDNLVDERRYMNGSMLFPNGTVKRFKILPFGHADFVWGGNANELIYSEILKNL